MEDKGELGRLFEEIALLLELQGDNPFKIRAYQNGVRILSEWEGSLLQLAEAAARGEVKGIGAALMEKIREFAETGHLQYYDELKEKVPSILFELVRIPGLGPKKARTLYEKLEIHSIGELEYACRENRLLLLAGFGEKTQERILKGIEFMKQFSGRHLLSEAWETADRIVGWLRQQPGVAAAEVAGSIRRRKETVKDMDIVVTGPQPETIGSMVLAMPGIREVIAAGATKVSLLLEEGIQLDVRIVEEAGLAAALHHFTGSKEHHVKLRGRAKQRGMSINEYGVEKNGERLAVASEEELYRLLDLSYIPPELREDLGEVESAAQGSVPDLVELEDIKGVFHTHTSYSDGTAEVAVMAEQAMKMGWEYLGFGDHSRSAGYAGGLKPEDLLRQSGEIRAWNEKNPGFRLLTGTECDILADGSLDYPDELLAQLDYVVASVHSSFQMTESEMTQRILRAMKNPYVTMIGHPTGRILLAREAYPLRMEELLTGAAETGTLLEVNASPYRLDLDWRWHRRAKEKGVLLAINPDAHRLEDLALVKYGVAVARKGGMTRADILNTRSWPEMWKQLRQKRND